MNKPPKIDNAPGLTWKPRKIGWEARWQARTDLADRGYQPKSYGIWKGAWPTEVECSYISDQCNSRQSEMLVWGRGGLPMVAKFDGTLTGLIRAYQTDQDSSYRKLRYRTRIYYDTLCRALEEVVWTDAEGVKRTGSETEISIIKARVVMRWHELWLERGKVSMGHSVIGMLRILTGFGSTILEDDQCARLSGVLSNMRFTMAKPRVERLTAEQAILLRAEARKLEFPSIAQAQAFQFELMLRQKDCIGEWVPYSEPGVSDIHDGNNKWLRGVRFEEIDDNMVLKHITSKRQKEITVNLLLAGMVVEEFKIAYPGSFFEVEIEIDGKPVTQLRGDRSKLPDSGAIIRSEVSGVPWYQSEFRRAWRKAADAAGVPKTVKNMDSRAGAISEATDAGAPLEHVRINATHSDIGMTQKYSRGDDEKTASVMVIRSDFRKNKA